MSKKICLQCQVVFKPRYKEQKYCSYDCYWSKDRTTITCQQCGKTVTVRNSQGHKNFCSKECLKSAYKKQTATLPITLICQNCHKSFQVKYSQRSKKYCSRECYWDFGRTTLTCAGCKKPFTADKSRLDNGSKRHFCSKRCAYDHHEKPSNPIKSTCTYCGKPLTRARGDSNTKAKNHFCNLECDHAWRKNGGNPSGDDHPEYNSVEIPCANCGSLILRQPYRLKDYNNQFCSRACNGEWRSKNIAGPDHPRWRGGDLIGYRGPNWQRQSAKARRRDGFRCRRCGKTQDENGRKLDVHHLRSFRSFNYIPGENETYREANRLSNLVSLCKSCHQVAERMPLAEVLACLTPTQAS